MVKYLLLILPNAFYLGLDCPDTKIKLLGFFLVQHLPGKSYFSVFSVFKSLILDVTLEYKHIVGFCFGIQS